MQNNVLTARDGYVYTNGETDGYIIRLGVNDSADNWYEITEEETEELQQELEANAESGVE